VIFRLTLVFALLAAAVSAHPSTAARGALSVVEGQTPAADLKTNIDRLAAFDYPVRMNAARVLRRAAPAEAVAALTQAVRSHKDAFVRYRALILLTSFSRIVIVLGLLRQALGTPQMPPSQVLIGLALFLTAFVMAPVAAEVRDQAYTPYMTKKITQDEALQRALRPIREFMLRQTREQDLALMLRLSKAPRPRTREEVPTTALIPAFVISELKSGFQMGFVLFLPFLVIDFVVGSVLLSMGMMFLPPTTIALPLKLLLFVLADGWHLVVRSLVTSFQ